MDRITWNQFILEHGPRSGRFLQSWEWGEFLVATGDPPSRERGEERVRREEFVEGGELVGVAQWVERKVPGLGRYAFCPKGPIQSSILRDFSPAGFDATKVARKMLCQGLHDAVFLRIEPDNEKLVAGARKSIDLNPAHTLMTDLSASEEKLLAAMHPKTRYNIRIAQKHGVVVNLESRDFETVWHLFEQTSSRGQFRLHRRGYYLSMLETLAQGDCRAFLATASHGNDLLAGNVMIDFGDTRTYLHGASASEQRQHMAPYLLHWELMRDARARGLRWYDWWGVAPPTPPSPPSGRGGTRVSMHPWAGISRFKRGFGGEEVASPGTYDLILKPLRYRLYQLARRIRRIV